MAIFAHREQILRHHAHWTNKPSLQRAYHGFYRLIASSLSDLPESLVVELGSGIGSIRDVIPQCVTTDLFPTPWSDLVENAYELSFPNQSVSDLILVDVFHHLQYPGTALNEFHRLLRPGGRVIMLEPCISALSLIVYGLLHPEGLRFNHKIQWLAPPGQSLESPDYYTSQGNATSIFLGRAFRSKLDNWQSVEITRLSALAYLATGGYTKPQLVRDRDLPVLKTAERWFDPIPALFATRMLVVLTK